MSDDPRQHLAPGALQAFRMAHQMGQRYITDEAFAKRFKAMIKKAKETFEHDGYHDHLMLVHMLHDMGAGAPFIVPIQFMDWPPPGGKKYEAMEGLGVKVAEDYPEAMLVTVTHISEGWMAQAKDDEFDGNQLKPGVKNASERPDKLEVLTISLTSQDLRQSSTSEQIIRSQNGRFRRWGATPMRKDYDPTSDIHPFSDGDQLALYVIRGYSVAKKVLRNQA